MRTIKALGHAIGYCLSVSLAVVAMAALVALSLPFMVPWLLAVGASHCAAFVGLHRLCRTVIAPISTFWYNHLIAFFRTFGIKVE